MNSFISFIFVLFIVCLHTSFGLEADSIELETTNSTQTLKPKSIFENLVGDKLYGWVVDTDEKGEKQLAIYEFPTSELLKDKKVVALYFSASWCGPCRQFTPILAEFYKEMSKKKKGFEVIWVSQDRSVDDYVQYFQHMPWLAIPPEKVGDYIESLAAKYQLKGIPHLVLLDGQDASIITLEGRAKILEDPNGLSYPWGSRSLLNILPSPIRTALKSQINKVKNNIKAFLLSVIDGIMPLKFLKNILRI